MGNKISKKEKQRLEAEAKKKAEKKNNMTFIFLCMAMIAVMWVVTYFFNGSELANRPAKNQVVSVEITNTKFTDEVKIMSTEDEIKMACSVLDLVRVKHNAVEGEHQPYLTLVYHMKDGSEKVLQLSEETAVWEGETKPLAREKMMLETMDAVFFPEYVEQEKDN